MVARSQELYRSYSEIRGKVCPVGPQGTEVSERRAICKNTYFNHVIYAVTSIRINLETLRILDYDALNV